MSNLSNFVVVGCLKVYPLLVLVEVLLGVTTRQTKNIIRPYSITSGQFCQILSGHFRRKCCLSDSELSLGRNGMFTLRSHDVWNRRDKST